MNGTAPAPLTFTASFGQVHANLSASARLTFHATTGALEFETTISGTDQPITMALHRLDGERVGPIVAHLGMRGQRSARGTLVLRGRDRDDFAAGRVGVRLYTAGLPLGSPVVRVTFQ